MAKIFMISDDEEAFDYYDAESIEGVDERMIVKDVGVYVDMLKWLVDSDINFHSHVDDNVISLIFKDEDAVAFKLRWL